MVRLAVADPRLLFDRQENGGLAGDTSDAETESVAEYVEIDLPKELVEKVRLICPPPSPSLSPGSAPPSLLVWTHIHTHSRARNTHRNTNTHVHTHETDLLALPS